MTAPADRRAPFERVADDLRGQIRSGELAPGDRLPSGRELAERYAIALVTAQNALTRLRDEGLATSSPRGYYVAVVQAEETDDVRRLLTQTRAELQALRVRVERLESDSGT